MGALDDIVRQGKARYVGCSNFPPWKIVEALWISQRERLASFSCIQNQYNLLNRWEMEPELMPLCRQFGLGIMTYSPLAIGLLSGRFRRGQVPPPGTPWSTDELRGMSPGKYNFAEAMTEASRYHRPDADRYWGAARQDSSAGSHCLDFRSRRDQCALFWGPMSRRTSKRFARAWTGLWHRKSGLCWTRCLR